MIIITLTSKQRGISLLEVMIALIVLSIGLLGLAQLQMTGIKQNQDAWLRSQATNLTYDMLDRLRANRNAARGGNYDQNYDDIANQIVCVRERQALNIPAGANQATRDLIEWNNLIACALPDGKGRILRVGSTQFTVEIRWNEDRTEQPPSEDEEIHDPYSSYRHFSITTEL